MLADVAKVLMTTLNVDDVGLVQNRSRVYQGAGRSAEGQFSSNAPVETVDIMAEEAPGADSIAVRPESQIRLRPELRSISKKLSVAAKLCDIFSMIFGGPPTTSRIHSRSA